ncbi:hypothetical protein F3F96_10380 [Mariprofundus sp. NF]|uniref:hypothetical protein n=1 Tax=Mariprofundus sp. NF TaxID=2608716 RepID=UPI0015A1FE6E|nr:hypothetical protein [Mariprofundus sp. NF]NWF39539.1 hypothetical protein [Mariprofundus sp. NF]
MNHKPVSKVPVSLWLATLSGLLFVIMISDYFHQNYKPPAAYDRLLMSFVPERLKRIQNHGLIVIGTSMVSCGFPYDEKFESLAAKKNMKIEFVRFSRNAGRPSDFESISEAVLKSKPRWIFLQAEPFFLELSNHKSFFHEHFDSIRNNVRFMLEQILIRTKLIILFPLYQDDRSLKLEEVATIDEIKNAEVSYQIKPPVSPKYFESFLKHAKENNIKVILLEMNRSKEGNEYFGDRFRAQLNRTLQQVSEFYQIPLWQFRSDLPLEYYSDRAHLNRKGRAVFSDWFLSKLAQENHHD